MIWNRLPTGGHLQGCERVRSGENSSVLMKLIELCSKAVSVPGHLETIKNVKIKRPADFNARVTDYVYIAGLNSDIFAKIRFFNFYFSWTFTLYFK